MRVQFVPLLNQVRPKDHIDLLRPLLPTRYSPLKANGNGIQSVYLTEVPAALAEVLTGLIGNEAALLMHATTLPDLVQDRTPPVGDDLDAGEHRLEAQVESDPSVRDTEREAIIRARRGQVLFKGRVMAIESCCRITLVENPVHLVASHCEPWRDSTNQWRLNGENGLLLTPSIDHLFDRGFIGFEGSRTLIISPVAHRPSLDRMGIERGASSTWVGLPKDNGSSVDFHRNSVLVAGVAVALESCVESTRQTETDRALLGYSGSLLFQPLQLNTGSRGYFGNAGFVSDSVQR